MALFLISLLSVLLLLCYVFYFIARYDKKETLPSGDEVFFSSTLNYPALFGFPLLVFSLLLIATIYCTETLHLSFLLIIAPFFITVGLSYMYFRAKFFRYYFTDKGMEKLNLITHRQTLLQLAEVEKTGWKTYQKSSTFYIITQTGRIKIDGARIANKDKFKDYFLQHGISYFQYDALNGRTKTFSPSDSQQRLATIPADE